MGEQGVTLQLSIPASTKKQLQIKAVETGDPVRLLVLRALSAAGYDVPAAELTDRRKARS